MKFIVDESTGASVVFYFRNAGHDVLSVVESMPSANDLQILQLAVDEVWLTSRNRSDLETDTWLERN